MEQQKTAMKKYLKVDVIEDTGEITLNIVGGLEIIMATMESAVDNKY